MIGPSDIHSAARLFEPERLTLAREVRGLTKAELAEKIGKTPSAVSQFESGRSRPDGQTIGRLILALGTPASFFASTPDTVDYKLIPLDRCHFRSLRSTSQKNRRALLARGSLICGLLSFLEKNVILPHEQITALAATPANRDEVERLALEVRARWGSVLARLAIWSTCLSAMASSLSRSTMAAEMSMRFPLERGTTNHLLGDGEGFHKPDPVGCEPRTRSSHHAC
ncbi:MAG: helix-turn-helix transcriptional regulator [Nannocystis sp.]|nr:helix-turn-helix transcriptional regulator [Nannocystis sp.]